MAITLKNRDTKIAETNIPQNDKSAFRAMGKDGFDDMMRSGVVRNNPSGQFAGEPVYASKGAPLDRYASPIRRGGDAIVEYDIDSTSSAVSDAAEKNHVRTSQPPNRYTDKVRVWERTAPGEYQVAYDNFNPAKRAARTVGAEVLAPAATLAVPEAVAKGMLRLAGGNKQPNAQDFLVDLGSGVTGGAVPDAGPVPEFKYGDEGNWTPSRTKSEREAFSKAWKEQTE